MCSYVVTDKRVQIQVSSAAGLKTARPVEETITDK